MYFQTKIIPQATEPAKLAHRPQMFFFLGNIQRFQYHILESGNEWSRISNRRHHAKALDAPLFCVHSAVNINFVQSFNMFGHKRNWHHQHLLNRSEEHTSELQSRFGISYAVFCLKKK